MGVVKCWRAEPRLVQLLQFLRMCSKASEPLVFQLTGYRIARWTSQVKSSGRLPTFYRVPVLTMVGRLSLLSQSLRMFLFRQPYRRVVAKNRELYGSSVFAVRTMFAAEKGGGSDARLVQPFDLCVRALWSEVKVRNQSAGASVSRRKPTLKRNAPYANETT